MTRTKTRTFECQPILFPCRVYPPENTTEGAVDRVCRFDTESAPNVSDIFVPRLEVGTTSTVHMSDIDPRF